MSLFKLIKHLSGNHDQKSHGRGHGNLPMGLRIVSDVGALQPGAGYFITPSNDILDFTNYEDPDQAYHLGVIEDNYRDSNFAKVMGFTPDDIAELDDDIESGLYVAMDRGNIRVANESGGGLSLQTTHVDRKTLRRLQKLYDESKITMKPGALGFWEDQFSENTVSFTFEEFLDAKRVVNGILT